MIPAPKRQGGSTSAFNHLITHIDALNNLGCALHVIIGEAAKLLEDEESMMAAALRGIFAAVDQGIEDLRTEVVGVRDDGSLNIGSVPVDQPAG